ncbi:MAG: nitrate/nitrite transporter NrtS [Actinomycetota bacterium]|nr:nitrate/nitrite transporter NrtS [Actinomycetota bacterium]
MARKTDLSSMTWVSYREAFSMFVRGATVPTATRIALIVGTWLSVLNLGSVIVNGHPPWVKLALNYLTPFVVASLGFLAARRRSSIERLAALLRPSPIDHPNT